MKTFTEIREALNAQQRAKARATFRRSKAKIQRGRKKAAKKKASTEKLIKRAEKTARKMFIKKAAGGKDKDDLSFAQRQAIEKKVDKKKTAIKRLAKKLLPSIRKKELARLAKARGSK